MSVFSTIKSFPVGKYMKIVVNVQSSEVREINAVFTNVSLYTPTHFLLYINDFIKNIFQIIKYV